MDLIIVYPEPGMNGAIAKRLLAVADSPYDVRIVTNPRFGYQVPQDLFERFEADSPAEPESPKEPHVFVDGDTDLGALKKRGRPRKSVPAKAEEGEK